jgi:hypothetical protein
VTDLIALSDEDLALCTPAEIEEYLAYLTREAVESQDWQSWISLISPQRYDFAPHHVEFWRWVWSVRRDLRPPPFIAIWPRGGAKSTSTELACVLLAARGARKYGLYVCESQDQADDHVSNVAALLELDTTGRAFPDLAARAVGKYGNVRGWRRNRLMTQSGFILDALGLDTASRGVKIENQRPDLLVLDDIDNENDTQVSTARKIKTLTQALLPAGSNDVGVLMCQNLVHQDSIFARLADGRANFLTSRIVSGPIPAIRDLGVENRDGKFIITDGTATWTGQDLDRCQEMINDMGISAFLSECQHDTEPPPGGMFDHLDFKHIAYDDLPDLVRTCCWVDPAVTDNDQSDAMGVQVAGIDADGTIYMLWCWERRATPLYALQTAIRKAVEYGCDVVGIETDQGGETWGSVFREAAASTNLEPREVPRLRYAKAGSIGPKTHRASMMLTDYEKDRIVHVIGPHTTLERALRRFPRTKPFDLVDATFWAWRDLRPGKGKRLIIR